MIEATYNLVAQAGFYDVWLVLVPGMEDKKKYRIKAALIEGMVRRRQWSMSYKTLEDTLSKLPSRNRGKGRKIVEELVNQGWAEYHKNGSCVSLNSSRRAEIKSFLERHSDMEDWMLETLF